MWNYTRYQGQVTRIYHGKAIDLSQAPEMKHTKIGTRTTTAAAVQCYIYLYALSCRIRVEEIRINASPTKPNTPSSQPFHADGTKHLRCSTTWMEMTLCQLPLPVGSARGAQQNGVTPEEREMSTT